MRELLLDDNIVNFTFVLHHDKKIAASGEGHKPNPDKQRFVAESEFVLLGILSEQCLIIYFYCSFQ